VVNETTSPVSVRHYGTDKPAPRTDRARRLETESKWIVQGPRQQLADIADELPKSTWTWAGDHALILNLVNSVGVLELPHLGTLDLVTRKFGQDQFDAMLRELTDAATTLPFSANKAAAGRYSVSTAPRDEVGPIPRFRLPALHPLGQSSRGSTPASRPRDDRQGAAPVVAQPSPGRAD